MNFLKLDAASADPRPRWKLAAHNIVEIRLRGITSEVAANILIELAGTLDGKLAAIFERAAFSEAPAILDDFDTAVLAAARTYHAQHQKLAGTGVEDFLDVLLAHGWNAIERGSMNKLLTGERLARVDFRWIETVSGRRFTRTEIQAAAEPVTVTNGKWGANFISESALLELEHDATEKAARQATPPVYGRNLDLKNGVRPSE